MKLVLRRPFGVKKDPSRLIEYALSLRIGRNQPLKGFVEMTSRTYDASRFIEELKFVFLSKAAMTFDDLRTFILQRAPSTCTGLQDPLLEYHHYFAIFKQVSQVKPIADIPNMRMHTAQQYDRNATTSTVSKNVPSAEELGSQLPELSIIVKKQFMTIAGRY